MKWFQKLFIVSSKKRIECFPGKNPVNLREKSGDITVLDTVWFMSFDSWIRTIILSLILKFPDENFMLL